MTEQIFVYAVDGGEVASVPSATSFLNRTRVMLT
jgi:hypothetical protein